jgi:hypothetical protein
MPVKYQKQVMSSGKELHIWDGLLPLQLRDSIYSFVSKSMFRIGWQDGTSPQPARHHFLYSSFTEQETEHCGLLPFLKTTAVNGLLEGLKLEKSIVNLSVPSDTHFAHSHPEKLVVLYYANMEWEQHWHGETLFYSEDLTEIEYAGKYTPGRVIAFDASIPHAMRPQSPSADHYRFTYALTFN